MRRGAAARDWVWPPRQTACGRGQGDGSHEIGNLPVLTVGSAVSLNQHRPGFPAHLFTDDNPGGRRSQSCSTHSGRVTYGPPDAGRDNVIGPSGSQNARRVSPASPPRRSSPGRGPLNGVCSLMTIDASGSLCEAWRGTAGRCQPDSSLARRLARSLLLARLMAMVMRGAVSVENPAASDYAVSSWSSHCGHRGLVPLAPFPGITRPADARHEEPCPAPPGRGGRGPARRTRRRRRRPRHSHRPGPRQPAGPHRAHPRPLLRE